MFRAVLKKNLDYYCQGFSGEQDMFQDFLNDLKSRHDMVSVSVFCDYGSHGLEILETTIFAAEDFYKLKQNIRSMCASYGDFLGGSKKSISTVYGTGAKMRSGVKDMQIYHFKFKDGLYDCYVVCESDVIFRKEVLVSDTICLLKSFLYQRQLKDFHKIGYSYDGYMGLPSRDELLNRISIANNSKGKTSYLLGVRIANRAELEEQFYKLSDVMYDFVTYFNGYYKGGLFALGSDRIVIIYEAVEALVCVDKLEAHITELSQKFPWVSVSANVTPVISEPLEVLYELEKGLLGCAPDTIVVSRRCRKISAFYDNSEQYRNEEDADYPNMEETEEEQVNFELWWRIM